MKKRWICLFVENEIGVLAKISGMFSGKSESVTTEMCNNEFSETKTKNKHCGNVHNRLWNHG